MPPPPVFLSYASEDRAAVAEIAAALRAEGVEAWLDAQELRGGDEWDATIRERIQACGLFVPVLSAHTARRSEGYFRFEWKLAVDRSHRMAAGRPFLLPVVLDAAGAEASRVPERFRDVQWTPARDSGERAMLARHLRELVQGLDAGTPSSSGVPSSTAQPALPSSPSSSWPLVLTRFFGRDPDLAALATARTTSRVVTLVGPGGAGKTRLALEHARPLRAAGHAVVFADLSGITDPAFVAPAVATALGAGERPGERWLAACARRLRESVVTLLIVDNCEQVVQSAAETVEQLLAVDETLSVLATSREPLRIGGEAIVPVLPLTLSPEADDGTFDPAARGPAAQLFVDRARTVRPGFTFDATSAAIVVRVCRRLDGLPLALELAAARLRAMPLHELERRLEQDLHVLAGGSRTAQPRQQTLHALIDWSHALLAPDEQVLLRRLSVFAGGWKLAQAEAVCADALVPRGAIAEANASLVEKSLVVLDDDGSRYRLLETLRHYAGEKLRAAGETEVIRARHLAAFLAEAGEVRHAPASPALMRDLAAETDNLRAALAWSVAHDPAAGMRLANHLADFWIASGRLDEGTEVTARLLQAAGDADVGAPDRCRGLQAQAVLLMAQGELAPAEAHLLRSLELVPECTDPMDEAVSLRALAIVQHLEERHEEAQALAERSHAIVVGLGNERAIPYGLAVLGTIAHARGDLARARACHEECLALARRRGDAAVEAGAHAHLGVIAAEAGDQALAATHCTAALRLLRELGFRSGVAYVLRGVARTSLATGDAAHAVRLFAAATRLDDALARRREPAEVRNDDALRMHLQSAVGDAARFEREWAAGWRLTDDEAIASALSRP